MSGLKQQIEKKLKLHKLNAEVDKKSGYHVHDATKLLIKELEWVLGLLADYKCIPKKQLEELVKNQPRSPWDFIKVRKWFEKLDKLLGDKK